MAYEYKNSVPLIRKKINHCYSVSTTLFNITHDNNGNIQCESRKYNYWVYTLRIASSSHWIQIFSVQYNHRKQDNLHIDCHRKFFTLKFQKNTQLSEHEQHNALRFFFNSQTQFVNYHLRHNCKQHITLLKFNWTQHAVNTSCMNSSCKASWSEHNTLLKGHDITLHQHKTINKRLHGIVKILRFLYRSHTTKKFLRNITYQIKPSKDLYINGDEIFLFRTNLLQILTPWNSSNIAYQVQSNMQGWQVEY